MNLFGEPDPETADPRHSAFIQFAHETYRGTFGVTLILDRTDAGALKSMLRKTRELPEFELINLQQAWLRYTQSRKEFDRQQGKPLRFFCANINRFMAVTPTSDLDSAREWVRRRLGQ